jgi:hypothetical protein
MHPSQPGCPRIGEAAHELAMEATPATISQVPTDWSRSNRSGARGGGKGWESYRQFAFVPTCKAPPKQSLNGAP